MMSALRLIFFLLAASLSASALPAAAWPRYMMVDIGGLADPRTHFAYTFANDINAHGQIVGESFRPDVSPNAFLWSSDQGIQDMGRPAGSLSSVAVGVNDSGVTVGWANFDPRPVVWTAPGDSQFMGDLPGGTPSGQARDVNNAGVATGVSSAATGNRAFRWTAADGMQDLGDLPGGANVSESHAINQAGDIVGFSGAAGGEQAVLWPAAGGMQPLPHAGGNVNRGFGVNDVGQVVGIAREVNGQFFSDRAVLWTIGGGVQLLGHLGNGISAAYDINNHGHVIGQSFQADQTGRGFLWTPDGGMVALDDLVVNPDPRYRIFDARAINDRGQIAAWAFSPRGVSGIFLTPIPEPTTGAMLLTTAAAIIYAGRRGRMHAASA